MTYQSTKTYGHEAGLTACFRQHRAQSHCNQLHGYALSVKVVFEAKELDVRNWVVDFGSLKSFKAALESTFDHKTLVAEDDPQFEAFQAMKDAGIADVVVVKATGCEAFAQLIYEYAWLWLKDNGYVPRCRVVEVEVREHGGNSALFNGF